MSESKLQLIKDDPWLEPYEQDILQWLNRYKVLRKDIEAQSGSLKDHATAYNYFGFNYDSKKNGW